MNYEIKSCVMKQVFHFEFCDSESFLFIPSQNIKMFSTGCFKGKKFVHVLLSIVLFTYVRENEEIATCSLIPSMQFSAIVNKYNSVL